ncbi:ABC transporter ATP-binding protein [Chromobacterium subtsugae]|uniref:ATP-binding cassette domain-containing protein n=1 Tax=Chromobacterium subtsugae TaxID=251747 RepID=UPI00128B042F|nr:ABC transporter ATP-binding protein [Chromobacterium subtsugae]
MSALMALGQQLLLAASTYCIAQAGEALALDHPARVKSSLLYFFAFALAAYLAGPLLELLQVRLKNRLWGRYSAGLLDDMAKSQGYAGDGNRKALLSWLSSEAPGVFESACRVSVALLGLGLNIVLTVLVFAMSFGVELTAVISLSMGFAALAAALLRNRMERVAGRIQQGRQDAYLQLGLVWDAQFYMRDGDVLACREALRLKTADFSRSEEQGAMQEQLLACAPICLTVLLILGYIGWRFDGGQAAALGALVATLPRSLQFLGNIHAAGGLVGKFIQVRRRLLNLRGFRDGLTHLDYAGRVDEGRLLVAEAADGARLTTAQLLDKAQGGGCGRYRVSGGNGAGKTSLLHVLKSRNRESVLITPQAGEPGLAAGSTGERMLARIEACSGYAGTLILLDEWDANLDADNVRRAGRRIDELARANLVVEVRHGRADPPLRVPA